MSPKGNLNDETPAERDMVLEEGDVVVTGGDSCAIISFGDMSTFIMKPRTKVVLDKAPEKQSKLKLIAGNIWVNLNHIYETGQLDVTMNQAIAGTKGTVFVAEENGVLSSLKVIEGLMSFKVLVTGEEIDVKPGEFATADAEGVIEKTIFDIESEAKAWDKVKQRTINKIEDEADRNMNTNENQAIDSSVVTFEKNKNFPYVGFLVIIVLVVVVFFYKKKNG